MTILAPLWTISCSSWLLLLLLLLVHLIFLKTKRDARPIKHPPRPHMLQPLMLLFHVRFFGLPHVFVRNLSMKCGPIMLLHLGRLPTLVISSAEVAKEILKTHDPSFSSRPPLVSFKRLSFNFIDVALSPYSEYWKEMRKMYVLKLFSVKSVQSFRSVREEEVSIMINSIISSHQHSSSSTPPIINLDKKIMLLTMNIVFRVLFGTRYQGNVMIGGRSFEEVVFEALVTLGSVSAADFVPYIGWIIDVVTGQHARLEKSFHELNSFLEHFINEYLDPSVAESKMAESMVSVLFAQKGEKIGGTTLTREHVKAVLTDIFVGGIDTTSASTVWVMAELIKNPRIMRKVQEEVRNCVAKEKRKVDESDLDQLHYLKMVVKEALRLHPPTPLLMPRECTGHCKINGYDIFPKTMVLVNVWATARDPDTWENPELFHPERFMDNPIDFRGQDLHYLPFGAGRRGCPAIYMATVAMELTLANLIYHFNWELPPGMKTEDLDMEEAGTFAVHKKTGLQLVPAIYD